MRPKCAWNAPGKNGQVLPAPTKRRQMRKFHDDSGVEQFAFGVLQ